MSEAFIARARVGGDYDLCLYVHRIMQKVVCTNPDKFFEGVGCVTSNKPFRFWC